jgi:hypothetical protein
MEEPLTLAELVFHAERFCLRIESAVADSAPAPDNDEELRLKIAQCRGLLSLLQKAFEEDELKIENASVLENFRCLVLTLMWVAFRARRVLDHRIFRMLVLIESGFTYLLVTRRLDG